MSAGVNVPVAVGLSVGVSVNVGVTVTAIVGDHVALIENVDVNADEGVQVGVCGFNVWVGVPVNSPDGVYVGEPGVLIDNVGVTEGNSVNVLVGFGDQVGVFVTEISVKVGVEVITNVNVLVGERVGVPATVNVPVEEMVGVGVTVIVGVIEGSAVYVAVADGVKVGVWVLGFNIIVGVE